MTENENRRGRSILRRYKSNHRPRCSGQALAEGTAMLIPLSLLFVAVIMLVSSP